MIVINFAACLVVNKRVFKLMGRDEQKRLKFFFSIVHLLSATLVLSAMSSRTKPELARAKRLDPLLVG